jgi:hypothetical protein
MEGTSPAQDGIEVPRLKFDYRSDERGSHGQDYSGWPGLGKADYPSARDRCGRARGAAQGGAAGAVAGAAGPIAALCGGDGSGLGAHHWVRELTQLGHEPRIMAAEFVRPFRKSLAAKNDANDAEAICTAVVQQNMRFVSVKSVEQRALLSLHRVRQGLIEERTASINRLRGVLAEFGLVVPQSVVAVQRALPTLLAGEDRLPALVQRSLQTLLEHLRDLDSRITGFDRDIAQHARSSSSAQRLGDWSSNGLVVLPNDCGDHEHAVTGQTGAAPTWLTLRSKSWTDERMRAPRAVCMVARANYLAQSGRI